MLPMSLPVSATSREEAEVPCLKVQVNGLKIYIFEGGAHGKGQASSKQGGLRLIIYDSLCFLGTLIWTGLR